MGPSALPVLAYAPLGSEAYQELFEHSLAHTNLSVGTSVFVVDMVGISAPGSSYDYRFRVTHTSGSGVRVWPTSANISGPDGEAMERYCRGCSFVGPRVEEGIIIAGVMFQASHSDPAPTPHRATLHLEKYRDVNLGVFATGRVDVTLTFDLRAGPKQSPPGSVTSASEAGAARPAAAP